MEIFKLFKKKKEKQWTRISFDKIELLLENKKTTFCEENKRIKRELKERFRSFVGEIDEGIRILEGITLEKRREAERVKEIVLSSLGEFIVHLKKLRDNIEKIDTDPEVEQIFERVYFFLKDFEKKSSPHFEKATYLIGKELGDVAQSIKKMDTFLKEISSENRDILAIPIFVSTVERLLNEESDLKKSLEESKQIEKDLIERNKIIETKISRIEKDIENTKKTREYGEMLKQREILEDLKDDLKNRVLEVRSLIDFKKLASIHHSSEKSMQIIKDFKNDLNIVLEKDVSPLLRLLNETESKKVSEGIREIMKRKQDITALEKRLDKNNKTSLIEQDLGEMKKELLIIREELAKQEKITNKFMSKIGDLKEGIIKEFEKNKIELY